MYTFQTLSRERANANDKLRAEMEKLRRDLGRSRALEGDLETQVKTLEDTLGQSKARVTQLVEENGHLQGLVSGLNDGKTDLETKLADLAKQHQVGCAVHTCVRAWPWGVQGAVLPGTGFFAELGQCNGATVAHHPDPSPLAVELEGAMETNPLMDAWD